jgi:DNA-binding response OmpR family regulator
VRCTIDLDLQEGPQMTPKPDAAAPIAGLRIMIVEDEFLIAVYLQEMFRDAGADVVGPYATLAAALDAAARETISAAVLDVGLGGETTEEVALMLQKRAIPFLFCTGQALPDRIASRLPDATMLIKPVGNQTLLEAVCRLARR